MRTVAKVRVIEGDNPDPVITVKPRIRSSTMSEATPETTDEIFPADNGEEIFEDGPTDGPENVSEEDGEVPETPSVEDTQEWTVQVTIDYSLETPIGRGKTEKKNHRHTVTDFLTMPRIKEIINSVTPQI